MKVHHLDCGTMCPLGGRFMDGRSAGGRGHLVCHCLLVETDRALVLVDTGLGLEDARHPERLSGTYRKLLGLRLDPENTARRHVERLGYDPSDVRHIVLTHLDFDHAGGLQDFPQADVHLTTSEYEAARSRHTPVARGRYRPAQWAGERSWRRYQPSGERWFGFEAVRELAGLPPEILLIPLPGHTWGHAGVAVQTAEGWLLHAGDAYFYAGEMDPQRPVCTPGLRAYQRLMEVHRPSRLRNQQRLRSLVRTRPDQVRVFCAHDASELEALQAEARHRDETRIDEAQPL